MAEEYERLPSEVKQKVNWNAIKRDVWYHRKTNSEDLTVKVLKVLPKYFPNMLVSERSSPFGAYLSVPGKGNAEISFLGMSISDVEKVLNSEIINGVYIGDDMSYPKLSFEQKDLDHGARVEIRQDLKRFSFYHKPHVKVTVWPEEKEENKKLLTTVTDDIRNHTIGWEL